MVAVKEEKEEEGEKDWAEQEKLSTTATASSMTGTQGLRIYGSYYSSLSILSWTLFLHSNIPEIEMYFQLLCIFNTKAFFSHKENTLWILPPRIGDIFRIQTISAGRMACQPYSVHQVPVWCRIAKRAAGHCHLSPSI